MKLKEIAAMLDGRKYGDEITKEIRCAAIEAGAVIVYGASDDLCEFDGAWMDEAACYNGGDIFIADFGSPISANDAKGENIDINKLAKITAVWCGEVDGELISWQYVTEIPHETFTIVDEDGSPSCRGIVFYAVNAVKPCANLFEWIKDNTLENAAIAITAHISTKEPLSCVDSPAILNLVRDSLEAPAPDYFKRD